MKAVVSLVALVLLAACATAPAPQTSAVAAPQAQERAPSRALRLLQAAGGAEAPTQAQIVSVLGAPHILRHDGAGAALTYRYEHCALLLLFAADGRNAMRLAEANPGPRRTGAATPSLAQCADEAEARGS